VSPLELDVDDGADDLDDLADVLLCAHFSSRMLYSASAPLTTSMISRVIAACRTLFSARGAPPPRALARRRRCAAVYSVASLGPQALFLKALPRRSPLR
jgi:hypothetical protein